MSTISNGLKQIAETIEALENNGQTVTNLNTESDALESGEGLTVEFAVKIPLPLSERSNDGDAPVFSAIEAAVKPDGTVQVSFEGQIVDEEGRTFCRDESLEQQSQETGKEIPPHRDPDALREAYEQCDTFVEMKRVLDTEVTPEAVRQQMLKHGIHKIPDEDSPDVPVEGTPDARSTGETESESADGTEHSPDRSSDAEQNESDGGSTESPKNTDEGVQTERIQSNEIFASDGGFQTDLTVEELKDAVQTSCTLYEATKKIRLDPDEAREMLKRLNLLDLVTGRLSTKGERVVTSEEINRRIRSSNLGVESNNISR